MPCVQGHSVQPSPNAFGLLFIVVISIVIMIYLQLLIAAAGMGDKLLDLALANSNSSFPGQSCHHLVLSFTLCFKKIHVIASLTIT